MSTTLSLEQEDTSLVSKPKILLVDKSYDFSAFKAEFDTYYHIFTARTAKEALSILQQFPIEIILVDQNLSDIDGIELFKIIISECPDAIRMLLAEANDADLMIKAINNAKVFRYITKPWDKDELKQSIDMGVKIYRLEKKNRQYIHQLHEDAVKLDRILHLIKKYVPEQYEKNPTTINPEFFSGQIRDVTIFFISIRNLNKFIQQSEANIIIDYFDHYFSIVSSCIEEHKGFVDKFVGNTIVGIFGAPISYINNKSNAVFCALDMMSKLRKFNLEYEKKINLISEITIAIHAGEAIVGNMGSDQYLSYTVVGKTVTIGYELLKIALNEKSETILISDSVYLDIKDEFLLEACVSQELYGKMTSLYKVLGKKI